MVDSFIRHDTKNYCGNVTFLAISTFQVLKATTMTSVMFLQDLKSKNTQVSRTGQCAPCINWQRLTVLFLYQCSQLWILLQIGRISRFLDNLADPCSEIQIFAEQSYLSSSTSNSAFSGTLYRERTNTPIFIFILKAQFSTNFIQTFSESPSTDMLPSCC